MGNSKLNITTDQALKDGFKKLTKKWGITPTAAINLFMANSIHTKSLNYGVVPFEIEIEEFSEEESADLHSRTAHLDKKVMNVLGK